MKSKKITICIGLIFVLLLSSTTVFASEPKSLNNDSNNLVDKNISYNDKETENTTEALNYLIKNGLNELSLEINLDNEVKNQTQHINFEDGSNIEYGIKLIENKKSMSRSVYTGTPSEGTWEVWTSIGVFGISYQFDLEKSGGYWKISNHRNLRMSGAFTSHDETVFQINRALETSKYPAEVAASANVHFFDNQWISIVESTVRCITTVKGNTLTIDL